MKAQLKNVLLSPVSLLLYVFILVSLVINYFSFYNYNMETVQGHDIEYSSNINDYDEKINSLNDYLDELAKKENKNKKDDRDIIRAKEEIKIYEYLKVNNIEFVKVFDRGGGVVNERFLYHINSFYMYLALFLVSACAFLYIIFTNDFDSSRYSIIYSNTRYKIVMKKIFVFLICQLITFLIIYGFNMLASLNYESTLEYYLIINGDNVNIIKISELMFHYDFMYYLYVDLFISLIVLSCGILLNKTALSFIVIFVFAVIFSLIYAFTDNGLVYIGGTYNLYNYPFYLGLLFRLFIIIPIILLVLSIRRFEKKDLY